MKKLVLLFILLAKVASAQTPAVANSATTGAGIDDPSCTFAVAPPTTSVIFAFVGVIDRTGTVTMSGFTEINTILHSTGAVRTYSFWRTGNGSTTVFQAITTSTSIALLLCVEVTGANTTSPVNISATGQTSPDSTTHTLSGGLTTTVANTRILAYIQSSNAADFANGSGFSDLEADGTFARADGQHREAATATNYTVNWTSVGSEDTTFNVIAVAPSGGGGGGAVRCCGGLQKGVLP